MVNQMTDGKPKTQPIEPLSHVIRVDRMWLHVTPEDFIDVVLGKNLTVIRRKEPRKGFFYYTALETGIVYITKSKAELREIRVEILLPKLGILARGLKEFEGVFPR